jgi:hypothetical protein
VNTKLQIARAVGTVRNLTVAVREGGTISEDFAAAVANLNAACAQVAARKRVSPSTLTEARHMPLDVEVES